MHKSQKGFTLIELLIVVAIIGILAAVIIPNVMTFMNTGRLNAARTEAENVKTAGLAYYADFSVWPTPDQPGGGSGPLYNGTDRLYTNKVTIGTYHWDPATGAINGVGTYPSGGFTWSTSNETWIK